MIAKRIFDIAFSLFVLTIIGLPLIGLALWVKLDSRGPVFFRQTRVGLGGREFRIYKFRTMSVDAERVGPLITVGADARVTRSGETLRHYKLDELPQFFNVLFGDMSVVGPRPEVPRYVAKYPPALRERVLSVRPGITDLASIEYRDENALLGGSEDPESTYVDVVMPAKLSLCDRYVSTRTFWGDLVIVGRTMKIAFAPHL